MAIHIVLVMGLASAVLAGAGPPAGAVQKQVRGAPSPSATWFHALQRLLLYRQHMGHCDVEVRGACGTRLCMPASMRAMVILTVVAAGRFTGDLSRGAPDVAKAATRRRV